MGIIVIITYLKYIPYMGKYDTINLSEVHAIYGKYRNTVKLLNNGHPFCRCLVAVVEECPLVRGFGKMSTNPQVWRDQGRLIYTKSVSRSFRSTKK